MMSEKVSDETENRLGDLLTAFKYRSSSPSQRPQAIQSPSTMDFQDYRSETPDIDRFREKIYEQEPSIFVEPQTPSLKDAGGNMTSEYASESHGAEGERNPHESQTATKKRKNLGHARTPVEYFALKRQRDLEINGMNGEAGDVSKRQKTTSTTNTSTLVASAPHTLARDQSIDDDSGQGAAASMPDFTAKTKKEQLKQITANIPKGYDTRRAKNQKKDLDNAVKVFGYKRLQAVDAGCLSRNVTRASSRGGIIGDEMGMGKTVTSLACISANPAHHHPSAQSNTATLVVVPNMNMANQWLSETRAHCKAPFSTCTQIYRKGPGDNIRSYVDLQIVITTYHEIRRQFPTSAAMEKLKNDCEGDNTSFQQGMEAMQGELFKERWYRVILDEAHSIKEYTTTKLYPYLRFIGAKFCNNRRNFMRNYVGHENAKGQFGRSSINGDV
ncbi:hypothetical protein N3K66_008313 [Trichothecium roseum]|uniref:Uncharacterized protein n=1 Tax=Trichothecium roseum TaxID=47278 RepID=A0ACC0UT75_9HYPO|nr:hypothetical protein N3K66_008313 [Trichothecium roseum]